MVGKFKFMLLKWDVDWLHMAQTEDWWQAFAHSNEFRISQKGRVFLCT
jgi:hypothetical protein